MGVNRELMRRRAQMLAADAKLARTLTRRYGATWVRIREHLDRLVGEIEAAKARGETIDAGWLAQRAAAEQLERVSFAELKTYAEFAERKINQAALDAFLNGRIDATELIRRSLPKGVPLDSPALPVAQVEQLFKATREGAPLRLLLDELGVDQSRRAREVLTEGIVTGRGPREVARVLAESFAGNQARALRVARTEMIGAYRKASTDTYRANSDVLEGWVWVAELSSDTCSVCITMHGTTHELSEDLDSHPSCRCSQAPLTKSWDDLGFSGVQETRVDVGSGEEWFAKQPTAVQRRILGPGRLNAYQDGVPLDAMVQRTGSAFGRGLRPTPLRDLTRSRASLADGETIGSLKQQRKGAKMRAERLKARMAREGSTPELLQQLERETALQKEATEKLAGRRAGGKPTAVPSSGAARRPSRVATTQRRAEPRAAPGPAAADKRAYAKLDRDPTATVRVGPHEFRDGPDVYKIQGGTAFRHKGVNVFVEDGAGNIGDVRADLEQALGRVPDKFRKNLGELRIHAGASPSDAYWTRKQGRKSEAVASAGDGRMMFYGGRQIRDHAPAFDHEIAHLATKDGGPPRPSSWKAAQELDRDTVSPLIREVKSEPGFRDIYLGDSAVNSYAATDIAEDWAESTSLYLHDKRHGKVGVARMADGEERPVTFADLFPARAKLLDGVLK